VAAFHSGSPKNINDVAAVAPIIGGPPRMRRRAQ
jgi:hypothetical protein